MKNPEVSDESSECYSGVEYIYDEDNDRYSNWYKGEALHQITTGATGANLYNLCLAQPS